LWPVQAGDYLEVKGGPLHRIRAVSYNTWPRDNPRQNSAPADRRDPVPGSNPPVLEGNVLLLQSPLPHPVGFTKEYRVLRAPRPALGESPLLLPEGVAIDLTTNFIFATVGAPPLPIDPVTGAIDVLFSPGGGLAGRGSSADRVTLWLRDAHRDRAQPGEQVLISIDSRSGQVGAHPVNIDNNDADPYRFTRDGRSSGL
jgi:hypothetical protein